MSSHSVQVMSHNHHVTKQQPITQPKFKHPPTHHKENLACNDGKANKVNAKQLILYKDDVNSY